MRLRDVWRARRIGRDARQLAGWWNLYAARFACPQLIELPAGHKIVVLSPHPDDETVGAGGALLKHHQAGCHLTTIVLTDGAAGVPGQARQDVARLREDEVRAAAAHLGIDRLIFACEPDGSLSTGRVSARLREWLQDTCPDMLYLPFFLDNHPDHRAVTTLLAQAMAGSGLRFTCCAYEVWSPLVPNILVDIGAQMPRKLEAIRCYQSQLKQVDYVRLFEGLNAYRAGQFAGRIQYAEAFYLADVRDYLALAAEAARCAS